MYSFHTENHVITVFSNERTMHILIQLSNGAQVVETTALVNCRATRNSIDTGLLCLLDFPLEKLSHLIITNNINRTSNAKGTIQWKVCVDVLFKEKAEKLKLMVLSLGKWQIILGMPWLKKWNSTINCRKNTLALPEYPFMTETPFHKYSPWKSTILKENPEVPQHLTCTLPWGSPHHWDSLPS